MYLGVCVCGGGGGMKHVTHFEVSEFPTCSIAIEYLMSRVLKSLILSG